jgi:hypothetical protein
MKKLLKAASTSILLIAATQSYASLQDKMPGYFMLEVGPYWTSEGEAQNVYIEGLAGDEFTANSNNQVGGLFGFGYLFHALKHEHYGIDAGVNIFYLTKTQVEGDVIQEFMFTNLSYEYSIAHIPVYAAAKGYFKTHKTLAWTVDLGLGVNFLQTSGYEDEPLTSFSLSDDAFLDSTNTTANFSAMAGVGVRKMLKDVSLELGYRFFYLGEGSLEPRTDAIFDDLSTGPVYVNALMLTVGI